MITLSIFHHQNFKLNLEIIRKTKIKLTFLNFQKSHTQKEKNKLKMFALLLAVAFVGQAVQGAPKPDCTGFCDDSPITRTGSYHRSGSYSSYSKSSRYGSGISSTGLGSTGARLEDLGEPAVSVERPGSWQDEKNYITDDGRGKMHYKAGQTVRNNGYSKFAEHSYSYGTHDQNARLSNAQVLSTAEFNQEFQSLRDRIRSFMGNFALGSGSIVNANFLQDFKNKANMYSSQMNDVCSHYDSSSAMYQQMRQFQEQFQRQVDQREREIQAMISQTASSSSNVETVNYTPRRPAAQIVEYTTPREDTFAVQRVNDQINKVQGEISNFWSSYSHVESSYEFSQNFKTKVDGITQQLSNLSQNPVPNEALKKQIQNLKAQFNNYVETITTYIKAAEEDKQRKEEEHLRQKQQRLEQERKNFDERIKQMQTESLRIQQELEIQKSKHQQMEFQLQQQLDQQRAHQRALDSEKQRLQDEQFAIEQEEIKFEQQRLETQRQQQQLQQQIQQKQQQLQQQIEVVQVQQPVVRPAPIVVEQQPEVSESVHVSGHSSYEHHVKGSYGSHKQGSTSGSYTSSSNNNQASSYVQPSLQSHVDVTAMFSKLQQDLHRLQNDVNNFNTYNMRLTSSNSASIVSEANSQASSLRQRLEELCSNSRKYQNQQILDAAEDLERNFDKMVQELQSQASSFSASAGFSSESSYSSSGKYSSARAPTITDIEIEHTKNTEVEIKGRPGRRYTASRQVDCVESQAGQPCVDHFGRNKRQAGGN